MIDVRFDNQPFEEMMAMVTEDEAIRVQSKPVIKALESLLVRREWLQLKQSILHHDYLDQQWFENNGYVFSMNWDLFQLHIITPIVQRQHQLIPLGTQQESLIDLPSFYVNVNVALWENQSWKLSHEYSYQHQGNRFVARPLWTNKGFSNYPYIQWKHTKEDSVWWLGSAKASWIPEVNFPQMYGVFSSDRLHPQTAVSQLYHKTLTLLRNGLVRVYKNKQLLFSRYLKAGAYDLTTLKLVEQFNAIQVVVTYDNGLEEILTDQRFLNWEWLQKGTFGWATMAGNTWVENSSSALLDVRYGWSEDLTVGLWLAKQGNIRGGSLLARWKRDKLLLSLDIGMSNTGAVNRADLTYNFDLGFVHAYKSTSFSNQPSVGLELSSQGATVGISQTDANHEKQYMRYTYSFLEGWLVSAEMRKTKFRSVQEQSFSIEVQWHPNLSSEASVAITEGGGAGYMAWRQQTSEEMMATSVAYTERKNTSNMLLEFDYSHERWGKSKATWNSSFGAGVSASASLATVDGQWAWGKPIHNGFLITSGEGDIPEEGVTTFINHEKNRLRERPLLKVLPSYSNVNVQFDASSLPMGWTLSPEFSSFQVPKGGGEHIQVKIQQYLAVMGKLVLADGAVIRHQPLVIYKPDESVTHTTSGSRGTLFLEGMLPGQYIITTTLQGRSYAATIDIPDSVKNLWQAGVITMTPQ